VGGPLARFSDPSPCDLAPRVRQVLALLLQGDGDKQIASRLKISPHTVNQYLKTLYRHFRVESRAELLARWIRRGWGEQFPWVD
jgi:DNA-binding CsgD family transcriptional regulator